MESIGILFVYTGNICRSPTAEAVFRDLVRKSGLEDRFHIDSAGTQGYHTGDPPDPRAIALALERGIDMREIRARKVTAGDFAKFHHVYAMDSGHKSFLTTFAPVFPYGKLGLFLEEGDVPDPYYGTRRDFEEVFDMIDKGSTKLLKDLRKIYGI
jgi:protein-tyrosine phosphatase